jgi:hypothetical protein
MSDQQSEMLEFSIAVRRFVRRALGPVGTARAGGAGKLKLKDEVSGAVGEKKENEVSEALEVIEGREKQLLLELKDDMEGREMELLELIEDMEGFAGPKANGFGSEPTPL